MNTDELMVGRSLLPNLLKSISIANDWGAVSFEQIEKRIKIKNILFTTFVILMLAPSLIVATLSRRGFFQEEIVLGIFSVQVGNVFLFWTIVMAVMCILIQLSNREDVDSAQAAVEKIRAKFNCGERMELNEGLIGHSLMNRCILLVSAEHGVDNARGSNGFTRKGLYEKLVLWNDANEEFESVCCAAESLGVSVDKKRLFAEAEKILS